MEKIKVLLVEDESEIQEYTATNLKSVESIEFLGAYSRAEDLFSDFDKINPDVAILDIGLPGVSGRSCKKIKSHFQTISASCLQCWSRITTYSRHWRMGLLDTYWSSQEALVRGIRSFEGGSPT
ncbi:MAG: response regulator [Saprospiraceae bacterium]|nr:response regulator [Saprospiraceae bacterium]